MTNTTNQHLALRIYVSSTDKYKNELLYESIILKAKAQNIAGATAVTGVLGFGASSVLHSYKFWEISDKVPVMITIVDTGEKVMEFYKTIEPELETMQYGCLVTCEPTNVLMYKSGSKRI